MVGSWALVEVPRYLYLAVNTVCKSFDVQPPFPLHFLRYNLFMILYPSGISGEYLQMLKSLRSLHAAKSFGLWYYTIALLVLYIPMGPFMIINMWQQRAKANKNRAEALTTSPKLEAGILFPVDKSGVNRTTSPAGQNVFAATFKAVNEDKMASACYRGPWRFSYSRHLLQHVKCSLTSKGNAIKMAQAGINFIYDNFQFGDGKSQPIALREALKSTKEVFTTHVVEGKLKALPKKVVVPYAKFPNKKQENLEGEELKKKLKQWADRGTIEPDTAASLIWAVDNQTTIDLSKHWYACCTACSPHVPSRPPSPHQLASRFVLLGAGAAMGPLPILLAHGANIVAVDVPNFKVKGQTRSPWWQQGENSRGIMNLALNSPGKCYIPLKDKPKNEEPASIGEAAGINLIGQPAEARNWVLRVLAEHMKKDDSVTVGNYCYLDGEQHVKVSIAMDVISEAVASKYKRAATVAYLCTPTDAHVISKAAHEDQKKNAAAAPWYQTLLGSITSTHFQPNAQKPVKDTAAGVETHHYWVDALSVDQGPNYILAKRMQHWRAILTAASGSNVSSNVAPTTATVSVTSNWAFKQGLLGFWRFNPIEIFYQELSNSVMGALLIQDDLNPKSPAKADSIKELSNHLHIFASNQFHGGVFRAGFRFESMGLVSAAFVLAKT